jgi:hypothetical protein
MVAFLFTIIIVFLIYFTIYNKIMCLLITALYKLLNNELLNTIIK